MPQFRTLFFLIFLSPALSLAAEHVVRMDEGSEVRVWVFTPQNSGDGPWPLAMIIPAGSGQEFVVRSQFWLGKELTERGWAIAFPVSGEGNTYFGENNKNIDKVIAELQSDSTIESGKSLLLGVSAGGTSALEIASRNPSMYFGVIAVPGRLTEPETLPALNGLPIFLRIGDRDNFRWHKSLAETTQQLESLGAKVNAALVPNGRHIFKIDWNDLAPWLESIR